MVRNAVLLAALLLLLVSCNLQTFEPTVSRGDVMLYWQQPIERVNGDPMTTSEIGGYEIRYRQERQTTYTYITLRDNSLTNYLLEDVPNPASSVFEVAVFDTDGIYSSYVTATD